VSDNLTTLAYLPTIVAFILALKFLSSPKHARLGNQLGAVGMALAIAVTLAQKHFYGLGYTIIAVGGLIGGTIGWIGARKVKMTDMPQMVALFNGVGGGAVALVALVEFHEKAGLPGRMIWNESGAIIISALIGSISFAGSMIAFGKLQGLVGDRPIVWRGQRVGNILLLLAGLAAGAIILIGHDYQLIWLLLIEIGAALAFGVLFVLPIGGADMPVVISLLNACTGLSASAAGFELRQNVLIVSGMLVGSSGSLLTLMMCRAMNRSLANVIFGAFGQIQTEGGATSASAEGLTVRATTAEDVAIMLAYAHKVIIVPGYGLAVAQAQHDVRQLADLLTARGVNVEYAIHPVAGRMPGHMNVLLAEANVPYTQLKEMDEINPEFAQTDVSLVIGANDVVNPAARTDKSSPIYGMPILDVDKSKAVVVLKRSMNPGFAGIENHLFYEPETSMLFGDAKDSILKLIAAVKAV
jgi:NAD(P) transhydrogenase subunit beta